MIASKIGTQNFSKAVQEHDFHDEKLNYMPAAPDAPGNAGGQKVGDVLNQIANPGGHDPNRHVRRAHNTLDKDDFLKLMLTQMKNQDPMNPMQSHEMAAQLAQFTSLEQLFNVNKNLESLKTGQDPMQKYEALNFLGKSISSDSRQIFRNQGDAGSDLRFQLMADAPKVRVTITDEQGQTVKALEFGGLKAGPNKVVWSGTNDKDQDAKPGKYTFNVEAFDSSGKKLGVKTETRGTITGVNYTVEGPVLMVGDQTVRLQDVQKIEDQGLKNQQDAAEALRFLGGQKAPQGSSGPLNQETNPEAAKAGMVPESVLQNLTSSKQGNDNGSKAAQNMALEALKNYGPQPLKTEADNKFKVKPEDKPEAKLTGAILPLELANGGGINTGGAFGR